ncbi:hypothetical protein DOTSEDRAFT_35550 [Dothistroma septosporum NZE10]|uniref:Uncharacterized protein n=1 Tax=Dothistroma septosporum (strain NZE10 / CBS 128990) TaxID=675120 RepID=M2YMN9_DOTSN|nr:hypothetical protein DOTSEDRAFT_35550 [Dothistroma septosporum NZE10]
MPAASKKQRFAVFDFPLATGVTYAKGCSRFYISREERDYDYGNLGETRRCRRNQSRVRVPAAEELEPVPWAKGPIPHLNWPACSRSKFDQVQEQAGNLFATQTTSGKVSQLAI